MPTYEYKCTACGSIRERVCSMEDRDDMPECHGPMKRYFSASAGVMPDLEPYIGVIDGLPVSGRKEHREYLARHGVEEVGNENGPKTNPGNH